MTDVSILYYLLYLGAFATAGAEVGNSIKTLSHKVSSMRKTKFIVAKKKVKSQNDIDKNYTFGSYLPNKNKIYLYALYLNREIAKENSELKNQVDAHNKHLIFTKIHEKKHAENSKYLKNIYHLSKQDRTVLMMLNEISAYMSTYIRIRTKLLKYKSNNTKKPTININIPKEIYPLLTAYIYNLNNNKNLEINRISSGEATVLFNIAIAHFMNVFDCEYKKDILKLSNNSISPTSYMLKKSLYKKYSFDEIINAFFTFDIEGQEINILKKLSESKRNDYLSQLTTMAKSFGKFDNEKIAMEIASKALDY
ncbi:MAG TPA: hypothetical protein PKJ33_01975 [Alphaproteobacteria bacterium]|nr:hypothetical protein [Alphaproteobacteria bacterium]